MSKKLNKLRSEQRDKVRILEQALSIRDRLFSALALRRGLRRAKIWLLILTISVPLLMLLGMWVYHCVDKAYSMSIDNITYESQQKIISKEQAMKILGIGDSVNMATLDTNGMQQTLENHPCIAAAHIRAEFPETLRIEIVERIPIVYVEMESAAGTGTRQRLFMDQHGVLFPVVEEYHRNFLGVPVWYLGAEDIKHFKVGAVVPERARKPIIDLASTANTYSLAEIHAIREIFLPSESEWKMIITLDNGAEVLMQVYDIRGQMERLAMILEHARATKRTVRSVNVIPCNNPTVQYAE